MFMEEVANFIVGLRPEWMTSLATFLMIFTWPWVYKAGRRNDKKWLAGYYGLAVPLLYFEFHCNDLVKGTSMTFHREFWNVMGVAGVAGVHYLFNVAWGRRLDLGFDRVKPAKNSNGER